MTRTFSAATAIALALCLPGSSGSALAADLPSRKGPPPIYFPPPPPLWTGFYAGLNAGGTWNGGGSIRTFATPMFPNALAARLAGLANASVPARGNGGFIGGGQIGYNWQFPGSLVAGVETDIQGVASSDRGNRLTTVGIIGAVPVFSRFGSTRTLDYLGTLRGRLGWSFTPTLLIFGTGGLAYGGVSSQTSILQLTAANGFGVGGGSFSDTRVGWTAGGGVEWMFLPNWSAKAEYLFYDLGRVSYSGALISGGTIYAATRSSTRFDGNIARAGLNYHFNWGAVPVVARY
jgi:outer membrane immunogenic protein